MSKARLPRPAFLGGEERPENSGHGYSANTHAVAACRGRYGVVEAPVPDLRALGSAPRSSSACDDRPMVSRTAIQPGARGVGPLLDVDLPECDRRIVQPRARTLQARA